MASRFDPEALALYVAAVQDAPAQIWVLERMHLQLRRGKRPQVLREDFAGAASEALAWVARGPARRAVAVERDAATIAWAEARAAGEIPPRARARLRFQRADVRRLRGPVDWPAPDLICAFNFSLGYLHTRADLLTYFRRARAALAPDGLVVANTFGGPDSQRPHLESFPIQSDRPGLPRRFDYHWEIVSFDAARNRGDYRIHFSWRPRGGRREWRRDAFRYDWRIWSPAELTEALTAAGFARALVWRHTRHHGTGAIEFGPVSSFAGGASWTCYVVGVA